MAEYNPKSLEDKIKKKWKDENTAERAMDKNLGKKPYYFLDGPPYATGNIHMGHAWNKILKDYYMRFNRMQGLDVACQPGYDTHGLPIEHKVEKELNISGKEQIEQFGIKEFNEKCKEFATKYINAMNEQFEDLGAWMRYDKPYLTLNKEYIEGAWYTFKKAHEKGFLYQGKYPVHVCPRCETAVAQHEVEFTSLSDPSIYVKFPVIGKENEYLVIWTTTPWTLPSNTGIMAHPTVKYAKVSVNNETWIMAADLVETVMQNAKAKDFKITETFPGKTLDGTKYLHPLKEFFPVQKDINGKVVMAAQFVTTEEGTGLVHTAPGHGTDDFKTGQQHNLQIVSPVDLRGRFKEEMGELKGVFVKDADKRIIEELQKAGALVCEQKVTHKYPKCWRCETPLLFIAVPQWFLAVKKIRGKLLEENESTNWVPDWAKARFRDWINSLGDWPVSRQRYWGIPLPIWKCKSCENIKVLGSSKELGVEISDLHRPFIDEVELECKCGSKMKRIPDVLDVWFDSGVASWASLGFPAKTKEFERMWPADLNIEGADQFRGWWNSELIASVLTFGKKPFKNILFHGMVLDVHGNKFSKSKQIGVAPDEVIEKYGRDAMRLYLLAAPPEADFFFDFEVLDESMKALNILFNSKNFIESYCEKVGEDQVDSLEFRPEDTWIISRANSLIKDCTKFNSEYVGFRSVNAIKDFLVNDFSRWYIKLIRERTRPTYAGKDKLAASYAARFALDAVVRLLAPITPYSSEELFERKKGEENSVHLTGWIAADKSAINKNLEEKMQAVMNLTESVLFLRQEASIRLRHPVKKITVSGKQVLVDATSEFEDLIKKSCNCKEIKVSKEANVEISVKPNYSVLGPKFGKEVGQIAQLIAKANPLEVKEQLESKGIAVFDRFELEPDMLLLKENVPEGKTGKTFAEGVVFLDTERTPELVEESMIRELIRTIQIMRKDNDKNPTETVEIFLEQTPVLSKWKNEIESQTNSKVSWGAGKASAKKEFKFEEHRLTIGI